MSRADWSYLEHLLEEGQEYSTGIGRVWLTVLFLFRMLVLGTAAESAWDDEQADFVCNTRQPGCTAVCYDKAFPISHFRYFVLQVIFVSTPTIFYFGYVAAVAGKEKEEEEEEEEAEKCAAGGKRGGRALEKDNAQGREKQGGVGKGRRAEKAPPDAPKLKGRLLCAYTFSILTKVLLEVGFILGLWFLYDGFFIAAKFECTWSPCPHTVDCFVSRPTEKTIFTIYTQAIATISLLLNLVELLQLAVAHRLRKYDRAEHYSPRSEQAPAPEEARALQTDSSESYKAGGRVGPPGPGEAACFPNPCESYGNLAIEVNWGPEEVGSDLLPSYVNCMGAMKTPRSPKVHYKAHAQHTVKDTRGDLKALSKQKHYV
ncbi:gap junction protein alpha 4 [Pseudoliparis swirei]|uniref:gap junction protein alpha 4 n=1 Tax=Pseudoliparis swirei TaxID=2059687 RepID=UPI0024BD75BF|nr:gap junction protein alpha 4 [Pseudoliparis swirei]